MSSFPYLNSLSFFSWHAPILCCLILSYFISPYQLRCYLLEHGWPRPLPTGPTHSTGGSGLSLFYLYPQAILLSLRYRIWSSFHYLILSYILVTYLGMKRLSRLKSTSFILSYQLHCCWLKVGWRPPLPRAHPFHRGEWGWWVMTMTMAGGVGGGTRNLEHIYIAITFRLCPFPPPKAQNNRFISEISH